MYACIDMNVNMIMIIVLAEYKELEIFSVSPTFIYGLKSLRKGENTI